MTDVADINTEQKSGRGLGRILLPLGLALAAKALSSTIDMKKSSPKASVAKSPST